MSVLFCTLGALILILIAGSLNATVADATQEKKFAKISEEHGRMAKADENLTRSLTDLQRVGKEQEELQRKREKTVVQIQGERASLADLRGKQEAARDKVAKKNGELKNRRDTVQVWEDFRDNNLPEIEAFNTLQTEIDKLKKERKLVEDMGKEVEELTKLQDKLEAEYQKLIAAGEAVDVSFRVEGIGAGHVPVYLDLTAKGSFVHRKRPVKTGEPTASQPARYVAEKVASFSEVALDLARGPGDEFVLLLVRPDQQEQLRAAQRSLMRRRVPFVLEPADLAWKLQLNDKAEAGAGDQTPPAAPPE